MGRNRSAKPMQKLVDAEGIEPSTSRMFLREMQSVHATTASSALEMERLHTVLILWSDENGQVLSGREMVRPRSTKLQM